MTTTSTINKYSAYASAFAMSYIFLEFIPFAAILTVSFIYFALKRRPNKAMIKVAGIFSLVAIFLIATLSTLVISPYQFSAWNLGKDVYYFIAPVLLFFVGLTFLKPGTDFTPILKTLIYVLTGASIVIFSDFLFGAGIASVSLENRYSYALDSRASTLAVLLILAIRPTPSLLLNNSRFILLLLVNLLLIFISLSRIDIVIALLSLFLVYSNSRWIRLAIISTVLLLTVEPFLQILPQGSTRSTSEIAGFFTKILSSLNEVRVSDYADMQEINANWRGYEAFIGIQEVEKAGGFARIIGVGFGSFAAGPFEGKLQEIPFFHNGYVTIYLKAGFMGLAAFGLLIYKLYRLALFGNREARQTSDPRVATAALVIYLLTTSILLKTLAVHGIYYSKTTIELFLIGMAISQLTSARLTPRTAG